MHAATNICSKQTHIKKVIFVNAVRRHLVVLTFIHCTIVAKGFLSQLV